MTAKIYCLADPDLKVAFYVGKTIHILSQRLGIHMNDFKNKEHSKLTIKQKYIKRILDSGNRPTIICLEEIECSTDPYSREEFWVNNLIQRGHPISNFYLKSDKIVVEGQNPSISVYCKLCNKDITGNKPNRPTGYCDIHCRNYHYERRGREMRHENPKFILQ